MANRIYRGPVTRQPLTHSDRTVAGAYKPGVFGTLTASVFTVSATAEANLYLLANRDFYNQDTVTAYASGDTGVAYRIEPGQEYQAICVAGDYDLGDPLTITTGGKLTLAASDDIVVAFYDQADATLAGDALADVVIANFYTATA